LKAEVITKGTTVPVKKPKQEKKTEAKPATRSAFGKAVIKPEESVASPVQTNNVQRSEPAAKRILPFSK
jgi:hypothetical protein